MDLLIFLGAYVLVGGVVVVLMEKFYWVGMSATTVWHVLLVIAIWPLIVFLAWPLAWLIDNGL